MKTIAPVLLYAALTVSVAADPKTLVFLTMERDANTFASPTLLVANAQPTRLRIGGRVEIELTATDLSARAALRMKV